MSKGTCKLCGAKNAPITFYNCCAGCNGIYSSTSIQELLLLQGDFETGAGDASTNDFILTSVNDRRCYTMIMRGADAQEVATVCAPKFAHISLRDVAWDVVNAYYNQVTRKD